VLALDRRRSHDCHENSRVIEDPVWFRHINLTVCHKGSVFSLAFALGAQFMKARCVLEIPAWLLTRAH
jgi:hypothetical protein